MNVGIVGVPEYNIIEKYKEKGANIIDLDEPIEGVSINNRYTPPNFCSILKRVVANIFALKKTGMLDLVIASVGDDKCNGMKYISSQLKYIIPIIEVKNNNRRGHGFPISQSQLPLVEKMKLIVSSVLNPFDGSIKLVKTEPKCGFWGVPPFDFNILKLFPDNTHVYGWARCMENKTPADLDLECQIDEDIPVVFFSQNFCQKSVLAHILARRYNGLFVEMDDRLNRSIKAKIEAFLRFNL
jgi:hypothetical protein